MINPEVLLLYSHLHVHAASQRYNNKDRRTQKDAWRITQEWRTHEGRCKKTSLEKYSPLNLLQGFERVVQGFVCERMLETEHKLHILTPLLWPSRCVFLVLLDAQPEVLGSTPLGLFRGPPSVGCGLPYHIWSLLSGSLLATALGPKLNWVK